MSRIRRIYADKGIFVGPAPGTGYHFIDASGVLNNSTTLSDSNFNLVFPINRVTDATYDFNVPYTDIKELGWKGYVARTPLDSPNVTLNFGYHQNGIINELRLGFLANYRRIEFAQSGVPFYSDNFSVSCVSGFTTRELNRAANDLGWPYDYRDKRNIFIPIAPQGQDLNSNDGGIQSRANTFGVYAFGNCYLTNYRSMASVGDIPRAEVSYICENMKVDLSGSGVDIPAVDFLSGQLLTGIKYNIPSSYEGPNPVTVLLSRDITMDFSCLPAQPNLYAAVPTGGSTTEYPDIYNIGSLFSDIKLQSYSLELPLNRESLIALDYRLPIDRKVLFPIIANISVNAIVGDVQSGDLTSLLNNNDDYNIALKVQNRAGAVFSGTALQYDVKRAKLISAGYKANIGGSDTLSMNFSVEIDPNNLSKGLWMSGLLNQPAVNSVFGYLLTEAGGRVLQEDAASKIIVSDFTLLY